MMSFQNEFSSASSIPTHGTSDKVWFITGASRGLVTEVKQFGIKVTIIEHGSGNLSDNIVIAPLPARKVARGLFGESLLAYLVISKFVDHLPLHWQIKIYERVGIPLAASRLSDNIAAVCRLLEPLYNSLRREVLANRYVKCDETRFRVQDGEKPGAFHMSYLWAYHAPVSKLVLFDYQTGRGQVQRFVT